MTAALTNHSLSGRFLFENPHFPQVKSQEKHPKNATPVRQRAERRVYENRAYEAGKDYRHLV